jgi:hypothetical protein
MIGWDESYREVENEEEETKWKWMIIERQLYLEETLAKIIKYFKSKLVTWNRKRKPAVQMLYGKL